MTPTDEPSEQAAVWSSTASLTASTPSEITLRHYRLWRESLAKGKPVVELRCPSTPQAESGQSGYQNGSKDSIDPGGAVYANLLAPCELTVVGRERPGLLADITDFLTSKGLNIVTGRIFSLPNSSVLDIFQLHDSKSVLRFDDVAREVYKQLFRLLVDEDHSRNTSLTKSTGPDADANPEPQEPKLIIIEGDSTSTNETTEPPSAAPGPISKVKVEDYELKRSFSNLAIVDVEKRTEMEAARRARASDIKRIVVGDKLYMYSNGSLSRYCFDVKVSENLRTLQWGKSSSTSLWDCAGVYYGVSDSPVFKALDKVGRRVDPPWLCFSLVDKNGRTFDFAASNDRMVDAWVLGLQTLCRAKTPLPTVRNFTIESLLATRAKLKIRSLAARQKVTTRQLVLSAAQSAGHYRINDIEDHVQSVEASHKAIRSELDDAKLQIEVLRRDLERANDRESVLKTKLRDTQQAWEADFDEIKMIELIGGGSFSEMWRAKWRGSDVACKVLKSQEESDDAVRELYSEVTTLSKLRHPNIVLFMTACPRPPHLSIVTEFCHGGNVYSAIRLPSWRKKLAHVDFVRMARDAARGMLYLHSFGITHRDLKSQNLLLDRPVDLGRPTVKVADFGLSRPFSCSSGTNPGGVMTSETGTYRWMAPEVIRHEPYSEKIDVYSYAVTIWEFFSGEIPFADMTPIQAAFAVADRGARPMAVSESARQNPPGQSWTTLIERCWSSDPKDRPRFDQVVAALDEMENSDPSVVPSYWARFTRSHGLTRRHTSVGSFGSTGRFTLGSSPLAHSPFLVG